MPSVEIVAVGTELLLGQLVDTNTPFIASGACGCRHRRARRRTRSATTASASRARFSQRSTRADGVITTGGLGPDGRRSDERGRLRRARRWTSSSHEPSLAADGGVLRSRSAGRCARTTASRRSCRAAASRSRIPTARRPDSSRFARDGKFVACMPGVPREMKPMLTNAVVPFLARALRIASERS